jgi:hypothetical protein
MTTRSLAVSIVLAILVVLLAGCKEKSDLSSNPITRPFKYENPSATAIGTVNAVQERHSDELLKIPEVVGTGIGTDPDGTPVLLIYTKRPGVRNVPEIIDGVLTRQKCSEGAPRPAR